MTRRPPSMPACGVRRPVGALFLLAALPVTALALLPAPAHGQAPAVGEPAPGLGRITWVSGTPVDLAQECERGRVVLLDFFGTWCPPCRSAWGERSALLERLGAERLTVVAVTDEAGPQVARTIADHPVALPWAVGCDTERDAFAAYVDALGVRRLPFAVVIDAAGDVVWFGDPRGRIDAVVEAVVEQRFDVPAFRARVAARAELLRVEAQARALRAAGNCAGLVALADHVLELEVLDEDRGRLARLLNGAAWLLLTEEACAGSYAEPSLACAERAVELTDRTDANTLDTLALALFSTGDALAAARVQRAALAIEPHRADLRAPLERYLAALPANEAAELALADEPADEAGGAGGARGAGAKPVTAPVPPRAATSLSAAAVAEDLAALHRVLRERYAGYEDLGWDLAAAGSSWDERATRFARRVAEPEQWLVRDAYALFADFLDPVEDVHFWIRGPASEGGAHDPPRRQLYTAHDPYFTGLRVRAADGRYLVVGAPEGRAALAGRELVGVAPVRPETLARGTPYLLPTVGDELLVGVFHSADPDAPLALTLRGADGVDAEELFPLHRGGGLLPRARQAAWRLMRAPDVLFSTVSVRTCSADALRGLTDAATALRDEEVVVLDLRGNVGGSDTPVAEWSLAFSGQEFRWHHAANLQPGAAPGPERWTCHLGSTVAAAWPGANRAPRPYAGRLFVLSDRRVASSGETFLALASQIPGAVVLGENSAGCTSYGNADVIETLPNTGITVRFGRTRFVAELHRPTREGVGYLPDLWLDDEDPYDAIYRLLD